MSHQSDLPEIDMVFGQIWELTQAQNVTQVEQAVEMLDRLREDEFHKLKELCSARATYPAALQRKSGFGEVENPDDFLEMTVRQIALDYNEVGKFYYFYGKEQPAPEQYYDKGVKAFETALHIAKNSAGYRYGLSNHIVSRAYFGLANIAFQRHQKKMTKQYCEECIKLRLDDDYQIQYAGQSQKAAKQLLQVMLN